MIFGDTRYVKANASFRLIDETAVPDCTPSSTDEATWSHVAQTLDDLTDSTKKIATLEHNMWLLDASLETIENGYGLDTGWVSEEISDSDGNISTMLIFTFGRQHDSFGLTVQFDEKCDSFATEYTIKSYRNNVVVANIPIVNTEYRFTIQSGLSTYDRIEIEFHKTSLPNRRVHVTEVLFGIVETFDDNSIIKLDINKSVPSKCDALPVSEVTMEFDNSNNRYDIINPQGAYSYLKFGMPLKVRIGIGASADAITWYDSGTYYFYKAETANDGMTAVFTCQDVLTYLDRIYFHGVGGTLAMGNVILEINAKIPGLTWDNQLNPTVENFKGPDTDVTFRELLRLACEALNAVCYVTTDGVITIKRLEDGIPQVAYSLDDIVSTPQIETDSRVTKVTVIYNNEQEESAEQKNPDEIEQILSLNPSLVSTSTEAQRIASYRLAENRRFKYLFTGRGNPTIALTDTISVMDKYRNLHNGIVIEHRLTYDGGLSEEIKLLGGNS